MRIDGVSIGRDNQDMVISIKAPKAENAAKENTTLEAKKQTDQVSISNEARDFQEQMDQIRESGNAQAEEMEKKSKCMIIAGRVAAGDEVSAKDLQYLMKNEPEMYAQAMKMRIPKDHPRKWDSISGEDDQDKKEQTGSQAAVENISIAMPQGETTIGVSVQ